MVIGKFPGGSNSMTVDNMFMYLVEDMTDVGVMTTHTFSQSSWSPLAIVNLRTSCSPPIRMYL